MEEWRFGDCMCTWVNRWTMDTYPLLKEYKRAFLLRAILGLEPHHVGDWHPQKTEPTVAEWQAARGGANHATAPGSALLVDSGGVPRMPV